MVLHELLLALVGQTGELIVPVRDPQNKKTLRFQVASDIDFISGSEKEAINRICLLGHYYAIIHGFIALNTDLGGAISSQAEETDKQAARPAVGLYVRALCVGLEAELMSYRSSLLSIEQEILLEQGRDGNYPLSRLHFHISPYLVLFSSLVSLLDEIGSAADGFGVPVHGGRVLQTLWRRSLTGIPTVQQCIKRLMFHCNRVMFNQISAWLVHGLLSDPYDEFFIQRVRSGDLTAVATSFAADVPQTPSRDPTSPGGPSSQVSSPVASSSRESPMQSFADTPHKNTESDSSQLQTANASSFHFRPNLILQEREWNAEYTVRVSMLPTALIPHKLAEKLVFIGRSVCLLQHASLSKHGLLKASDQLSFAKQLHTLRENPNFDYRQLEIVSENARVVVTKCLWELIVKKADLAGHLEALKNFFLLRRGEFYSAFLDESRRTFAVPPGARAARDVLRGPFAEAASKVGIDESEHFKRFGFAMDAPNFGYRDFQPKDFPMGSTGKGLVCNGSCHLTANEIALVEHTPSQTGSVWFSPRKIVDRGFTTRFVFRADPLRTKVGRYGNSTAGENFRQGFAFVLQDNDLQVRATQIKTMDDSKNSMSDGALFGGQSLASSLVVEFTQQRSTLFKDARHFISVFAHSPKQSSSSTKKISRLASAEVPPLFDGQKHTVRIVYAFTGPNNSETLAVFLEPSSRPVLVCQTTIRRIVGLEGGRAWVGFTSCHGDDPTVANNSFHITAWEYQQAGLNKSTSIDGWKRLKMEYKIDPPLDLIFFREGFDRYNALFRFLFDVKRVQSALKTSWSIATEMRHLNIHERLSNMPILALRASMQFLIDNIQFYLQVDVLEVQYHELMKKVAASQDFETVKMAHQHYLNTLTLHCFLRDRVISSALSDCFGTCLELCRLLETRGVKVSKEEVADLAKDYERQSSFLFTIISRKSHMTSAPHLKQLIIRIDYNNFFSNTAGKLGLRDGHVTGRLESRQQGSTAGIASDIDKAGASEVDDEAEGAITSNPLAALR